MSLEYTEKLEQEYPEAEYMLDESVRKLIRDIKILTGARLDPNDLGAISYEALAKWTYVSIKNEERRKHEVF
jgi:hypothetical protein